MRLAMLVAVAVVCAWAQEAATPSKDTPQGVTPRVSAAEYQGQAQAGAVTVAADFMGHSVPTADGTLATDEYIVVEAAFFGAADGKVKISESDFSLRLDGKKTLPSEPYGLVLPTLWDPEWVPPESASKKSKGGLSTDGSSSLSTGEKPPPPKVPFELRRAYSLRTQKAAMALGDRPLPQAGLIFFQYAGKTQKLRSVELIYSGAAGKTTVTLHP